MLHCTIQLAQHWDVVVLVYTASPILAVITALPMLAPRPDEALRRTPSMLIRRTSGIPRRFSDQYEYSPM